ncbi:MAG: hypothetical protein QME79_14385 [Bacillota bacterium]|nr:hypothetical protein [Bacillota bacterium]
MKPLTVVVVPTGENRLPLVLRRLIREALATTREEGERSVLVSPETRRPA